MYIQNNSSNFTPREVAAALQIWNRAAVSLLDIRHNLISPEEALHGYRLPASAFLYTSGGKAEVLLNDTTYNVERFGLFHGAKGTELSIQPRCDWLEYYMVLYKAVEPPFRRGEYLRWMEQVNPFRQQYGFAPKNPIFFSEELRKMYEKWKGPTPLTVFYGKAAFYRFVYEIYEELEQGHIHVFEPDVIAMAQRYFNEHYSEAVSIQNMCDVLGISYSHFHRSFKQQTGKSPQEYLIQTRLVAAQELLKNKGSTIREVAGYCGFQDERNFQRLFLKHTGLSPHAYRENTPLCVRGETVGKLIPFLYNEESRVSPDELKEKGATFMFKPTRSKAVVAAALSLMLLMSACGTNPTSSTDSAIAVTGQVTESAEEGTRTISTVMGDVEVPVNPKRIAVWVYEQELYSLGVTPVSVSPGHYEDMWPGIKTFSYAPEKEELLALEPDLLITYDDASFFENYQSIAPVICIPLSTPAEETLSFIGDLLNMPDQANELIQTFHKQVDQSKATIDALGASGKTAVLIEPLGGDIWIYDNAYGRGGAILYDDLGFKIPKIVSDRLGEQHFLKISLEVLPQYCDADYIVVVTGDSYHDLKEREIWKSMPAVKNNHVIEYDPSQYDGRGLDKKTLNFFTEWLVNNSESH